MLLLDPPRARPRSLDTPSASLSTPVSYKKATMESAARDPKSGPGTRSISAACSPSKQHLQLRLQLVRNLSIKRFTEFGANHTAYADLVNTLLRITTSQTCYRFCRSS